MATPSVGTRLCVGDQAVPLRKEEILFCDLHKVCDDMPDGRHAWHLLDLSVGRRPYAVAWLEDALGLPRRWWQTHGHELPFVKEALEAIRGGRVRRGRGARFPKQPRIVVTESLIIVCAGMSCL